MYTVVYYLLMRLKDLQHHLAIPIFSGTDVFKLFPNEPRIQINTQLNRMSLRGDLTGLKRNVYILPNAKIDEFVLANKLYGPSYVSLESALNTYGIIPDITANVTSVSPVTSKKISTPKGTFLYSKINKNLYFGFQNILDQSSGLYYQIATPEKALLDYIYIRKVRDIRENRVDLSGLNSKVLIKLSSYFPKWVREVLNHE